LDNEKKPPVMHPIVYYALFFAIIGAIGMAIANRKATKEISKKRWLKYFVYILITITIITSIGYNFFFWISLIIVLASLIEMIINNRRNSKALQALLSFTVFLIIAIGFLLYSRAFSWPFLLFIYFQVFIFDAFCQITGQLWGKHLLAPSISPTKTIEGLAGGWICCILAAILGGSWIKANISEAALFGLLTGFASVCGDLSASYYKRKLKIKDYSNWLPGQGGFLDRFDSLLVVGFFYYLLYILFLKGQISDLKLLVDR
jgi:phosphatidate cytidylyltransferase